MANPIPLVSDSFPCPAHNFLLKEPSPVLCKWAFIKFHLLQETFLISAPFCFATPIAYLYYSICHTVILSTTSPSPQKPVNLKNKAVFSLSLSHTTPTLQL